MGARKATVTPEPAPQAIDWSAVALMGVCLLGLVSIFGTSIQAEAVDAGAIVLGGAGVLGAGIALLEGARVVPGSRMGWSWTGFTAWALFAGAVSGRVWASLVGESTNALGWTAFAALTAVAVAAGSLRGALRVLRVVAPWIVAVQVTAVFVQLTASRDPAGTLPNSTYLGEALLLALPFLMPGPADAPEWQRRPRLILSGLSVFALAAAGSRVAAVIAAAWFVFCLVRRSDIAPHLRRWVALGVMVAVLAAGLVFARGEVLGSLGANTLGERPAMWKAAALAVAQRPVTGWGPDGFVAGGAAVTTSEMARDGAILIFRPGAVDPHSALVWVAVSCGVVGLGLFLWFLVEVALLLFARARAGEDVTAGAWALGGAFVVMLTAPAAIEVLPLMAFVFGVVALGRGIDEDAAPATTAVRVGGYALLAVLALGSVLLVANASARRPFESVGPKISPPKAVAAMRTAALWSLDPHLAYLASLHSGYLGAVDPSVAAAKPDFALIERAAILDTRNPFFGLERARTRKYYLQPPASVDEAFADAFRRWPAYPVAHAEYAAYLSDQGRFEEARRELALAKLVDDKDPDRLAAIKAAERVLGAEPAQ